MHIFIISFFFVLIFSSAGIVQAKTTFTITSFFNDHEFTWINGPTEGCSAINSYVMTYPDNYLYSTLNACGETFGSSSEAISDGQYYISLAAGGQLWKSAPFVINNGSLVPQTATPTPSQPQPTPTIVNHSPVAIAGTSLDAEKNIQLDASKSFDPDNDALTYSWKFENETQLRKGKIISLKNFDTNIYEVALIVSDGQYQSKDIFSVGVPNKKPQDTIALHIDKMSLDNKNGNFSIRGNLDTSNLLFSNIAENPLVKITLELQTTNKKNSLLFGVVGSETIPLDNKWKFND